jgi:hypothetical protein
MNWTRFLLAILASGVGASLTDWLFMGVLFHGKYLAHPEVWRRPQGGPGEGRAILLATLLGFVTCAAFLFVCYRLDIHSPPRTLKLAAAVWLMVPVPLMITNALWMKLHWQIVLSNCLGWLAKLVVAALAASYIMA